jgi:hypothetical protein
MGMTLRFSSVSVSHARDTTGICHSCAALHKPRRSQGKQTLGLHVSYSIQRGNALALQGCLVLVAYHKMRAALAHIRAHGTPQLFNSTLKSLTIPFVQICEANGAILQSWESILAVRHLAQSALANSSPFASDHGNGLVPA